MMIYFSDLQACLAHEPGPQRTFVENMTLYRDRVFQARTNRTSEQFFERVIDDATDGDPVGRTVPEVLAFIRDLETQNKYMDTVSQLRSAIWTDVPGGVKMTAIANGLPQRQQDQIKDLFDTLHHFFARNIDREARLDLLANPQFLDEPLSEEAAGWLRADPMAAARACNWYTHEFYGGNTPELRAVERAQREQDTEIARRPRQNAYTLGV